MPVLTASRVENIARHLLILSLQVTKYEKANAGKKESKDLAFANARYNEARAMASLAGFGPTEFAIWAEVNAVTIETGPNWRGRQGLEFDNAWLETATKRLMTSPAWTD